jgi:mono/diheme cytochrome c family protein
MSTRAQPDGVFGMLTGTISDFDAEGLFGVIDADDGRLILFNLRDIRPRLRERFTVGARVKFIERGGESAPRASALLSISADDGVVELT